LIIGSFSKYCPHAGIWMMLFIEKSIHAVDKFRYNDEDEYRFCEFSKYLVEIYDEGDENGQWVNLIAPNPIDKDYGDEYNGLGEFEAPPEGEWLFLDDPNVIEPYRHNYQVVANIIGKRAKYWFKNGRIWEKEGDSLLTIVEFFEKYIGKKEEK
jgi:hypothetical protein